MKPAVMLALFLAASSTSGVTFAAKSVNVAEPGMPVKITVERWSTDEERAPIVAALAPRPTSPAAAAAPAGAPAGRGAAAGRGRGRGRGPAAVPLSPIEAFTAALGRARTIGYIWTSDITGYAIKYAWHTTQSDGTERIILASDRRLGAYTTAWKTLGAGADTDYSFTLLELRTGAKGTLEGRASLTSKIGIDTEAQTVALERWNDAPAILQIGRQR